MVLGQVANVRQGLAGLLPLVLLDVISRRFGAEEDAGHQQHAWYELEGDGDDPLGFGVV